MRHVRPPRPFAKDHSAESQSHVTTTIRSPPPATPPSLHAAQNSPLFLSSKHACLRPRAGGTAPEGDFKELFDHLVELRQDGTSIDKVEAVYLDGVQQIQGRASQVGTSVENQFFGTAGSGQWRVYEGNPSLDDAPVIAFNAENGSIAVGRSSGVVDTGTTGYQLFDFSFLYPAE